MRCFWQAAAVWAVLTTAGPGALLQAGEYNDSSGFTFQYPEGWWPATEQTRNDLPEKFRTWLNKNANVDLSKLCVVVAHVTEDDFLSNLNVGLAPLEIPVTEPSVQRMLNEIPDQLRSIGVVARNVQGKVVQIGPNKMLRLQYDTEVPGAPDELHLLQFFIPGGGQTHVVTCCSLSSEAAGDAPVFREILESFRVPPAQGQKSNWGKIGSLSLIGGIVGAIIAGLVAGLMQAFKKDSDPARPAASDG